MRYGILITTVISALLCRAFLIAVYKVPSQKMAPTIHAGDFIFAAKSAYGLKLPWSNETFFYSKPERGDLVVFFKDSKIFIKRVIAVNLDEVELNKGDIVINNTRCEYSFSEKTNDANFEFSIEKCGESVRKIIRALKVDKSPQNSSFKLDENHLLVANDNRNFENDPDTVEVITGDQIIGKPLFIWLSYSSTQDFISNTLGLRWNRILTKLN